MSKFIIEGCKDKYVMSFIDDHLPASTMECNSIDEAVYEMTCIFKNRAKCVDMKTIDSMFTVKYLCESNKLPIELIGINLMNSDNLRRSITDKFGEISLEYLKYVGDGFKRNV